MFAALGNNRWQTPVGGQASLGAHHLLNKFLEQLQHPNDFTINRQPPQLWVRSSRILCANECLASLQQCLWCRKTESSAAEILTVCEAICVARPNSDACKWTSIIFTIVLNVARLWGSYGDLDFLRSSLCRKTKCKEHGRSKADGGIL